MVHDISLCRLTYWLAHGCTVNGQVSGPRRHFCYTLAAFCYTRSSVRTSSSRDLRSTASWLLQAARRRPSLLPPPLRRPARYVTPSRRAVVVFVGVGLFDSMPATSRLDASQSAKACVVPFRRWPATTARARAFVGCRLACVLPPPSAVAVDRRPAAFVRSRRHPSAPPAGREAEALEHPARGLG